MELQKHQKIVFITQSNKKLTLEVKSDTTISCLMEEWQKKAAEVFSFDFGDSEKPSPVLVYDGMKIGGNQTPLTLNMDPAKEEIIDVLLYATG